MNITGFDHGNRGVGIRDIQLILPSVVCSTHISKKIADAVGGKTFAHNTGCGIIGSDVPGIGEFFGELANHPNVSSVVVVGLGCETIQGNELADQLLAKNESTKYLVIQESGGMGATLQKGSTFARELAAAHPVKRKTLANLIIGIENSDNQERAIKLATDLAASGINLITATSNSTGSNFNELMRQGAHLVISLVAENQPPTGYPLFPVINIPSNSPLHLAIAADFDLTAGYSISELIALIEKIAAGEATKSESLNIGEILAPRVVRSA
jgi:altronate dehydratase large subunit